MNDQPASPNFGEELASVYVRAKREGDIKRRWEYTFWISLSLITLIPFVIALVSYLINILIFSGSLKLSSIVTAFASALVLQPYSLIATIFVAVFPFLFFKIFDALPFSLLQRRFRSADKPSPFRVDTSGGSSVSIGTITLSDPASTAGAIETSVSLEMLRRLNPRDLLAFYAERTSDLTQKIYARAGVYLLVGVVISFFGLAFFYVRSRDVPTSGDYLDHFLGLLPGFGILFFIEFVAFFFLRQYRSAMDEFRYFDAVRRNREENLVILKMFEENTNVVPTKEVLSAMNIYSVPGKLSKDETTDILESRKMYTDEGLVFERLVDALGTLRTANRRESKNK